MESVSSRQVLIKYSGLLSTCLSVVKVCKQTTYYPKMIKTVGIWLGVIWATMAVAQQGAQQRYVGLQLLNLNAEPDYGADIIEQSVGAGANLVVLTIYWDEVYKTATSQPDWRQPDRQMEQIARLGVKAGIRIMLGRKAERLQGFWTSNETMNDDLGRQLWGVYGRTCFSFAHAPTVTKAQGFLKEVCQRYNAYQSQGNILYVTFVNTPTQELGYHYETELNGDYKQVYPTGFDYSSPSLEAFKGWITQQYKRINKLNYIWGTKFTSLNDVRPPTTAYRPLPAYRTRAGKDWYLFSHLQLKNFIDQSIRTIKQVNPSYKVVNEYGAVIDAQAAVRGTIAFKNLDQEADGTKVHNDLYWNHRFITDVVRSNRPGKWIMNETFFSPVYSDDLLIKHFDECFENGCNVVTMVASTKDARLSSIFGPVAARWKNNPWSELRSNATISYKVTEVLDSTSVVVEKAWRSHVQPSPIEVKIEEDILGEDYWRILATNVYPVVANPIIDRATKPKKTYSYTLPKDVFLDPDGEIVTIEALEKPQWLTFSNGTLTGTVPDQLGESKITLRAIDDEGATVQTSFLLKIVNVNQKPVVKRTLPDFESSLNQTISYPIQGDIFDDPDGVIVRTQAIGLRPWMSFNSKEFSAYPQEQGTFTITLRGIDDDSSYAETSFKVKILNRSPIVKQLLPEKTIAQNKAFRFKVPTSIFTDPDGQITKVKAVGLPSWLTYDAVTSTLNGTPTQLGTYKLGIRAYDNGGDSVETAFVLNVDLYGTQNVPPVLRYTPPNAQLYVTQRFLYKISDSLFYDTNGYVDRIEAPNLPSWLTFKNNEITGVANAAGIYAVTLRAVDDDETSTSITFNIEVKQAQLSFELIQAGKVGTRKSLGILKNGDVLTEAMLPPSITVYANSEAPATKVNFVLRGPYSKNYTATRFPFTLFDEEMGFVPIAGRYVLEAVAFNDTAKVSVATIQFTVKSDQTLQDWEAYPNPFDRVCNVKLPKDLELSSVEYQLLTATGSSLPLNKAIVTVVEETAYIDMTSLSLPKGTYFLKILESGSLKKIIKILKL